MKKKKVRIVVLGSIVYDCVFWADRLPKRGETVVGYKNGFFCGGKGANQAVQAAKLGAEVYMVGTIGSDDMGRIVLDNLRKNGVNTDYVTIKDNNKTDTCCIHVDKSGNNAIIISPDAGQDIHINEVKNAERVIKQSDIFLTQLELNPDSIEFGLRLAKKWDRVTILNPAPPREITPLKLFKYADYLTPNETEAEYFSGIEIDKNTTEWCEEAGEKLLTLGAKSVVITLGEKGAYFTDGQMKIIKPAYKIKSIDSTASGDAFNAALSFNVGNGMKIEDSLNYANAAGAMATSKEGAQSSLSTYKEIEAVIRKGVLLST